MRIHDFDYNFTVVFGTPKKVTVSYFKKLACHAISSAAFHLNAKFPFILPLLYSNFPDISRHSNRSGNETQFLYEIAPCRFWPVLNGHLAKFMRICLDFCGYHCVAFFSQLN